MQKADRCEQLRAGGRNKRVMILEEKGDVGCAGCAEPFPSGKLQSIKTVAKQLNTQWESKKTTTTTKKHTDHFHVCAGTHRPTLLHTNMEVSSALAISDFQYLKYAAQVCYIHTPLQHSAAGKPAATMPHTNYFPFDHCNETGEHNGVLQVTTTP